MPRRRLPPAHGYLGVAEAAELLGITRQALYLRLVAGTMRGARKLTEVRIRWLIPAKTILGEVKATGGRRKPGRPRIHPAKSRRQG